MPLRGSKFRQELLQPGVVLHKSVIFRWALLADMGTASEGETLAGGPPPSPPSPPRAPGLAPRSTGQVDHHICHLPEMAAIG